MATLTLRDVPDALIDNLKKATSNNTASKAIQHAAEDYLNQVVLLDSYKQKSLDQEMEIQRLRSILDDLSASCAKVLEVSSQGDVFSD